MEIIIHRAVDGTRFWESCISWLVYSWHPEWHIGRPRDPTVFAYPFFYYSDAYTDLWQPSFNDLRILIEITVRSWPSIFPLPAAVIRDGYNDNGLAQRLPWSSCYKSQCSLRSLLFYTVFFFYRGIAIYSVYSMYYIPVNSTRRPLSTPCLYARWPHVFDNALNICLPTSIAADNDSRSWI